MTGIPIKDTCGFFILPQRFEGGGYYTYGTPAEGRGQYADPMMISVLLEVATRWCQIDPRKFGVGNISLAGGGKFKPHNSHRSGLEVDVRPIRVDGKEIPVSILDSNYDRAASTKLISLFTAHPMVRLVLFNDSTVPKVKFAPRHYDHFHVELIR